MTNFDKRSREFERKVSQVAARMEKRNAEDTHWWKSWVLTSRNTTDPDPSRPVFDDETANPLYGTPSAG